MAGNPVHSWGDTPYHQQSSFTNAQGRAGGHTEVEPFLHKVARGTDRNGRRLGFNERVDSALQLNDYVSRNPHQNWPELISPPNHTLRISPLCLAVEYSNLPMVVVLLSLGADLDISPMCGNRKTPLNRSKNFSTPESNAISEFMKWVERRREFIRGHLDPESSDMLRKLITVYSRDLPTNTGSAPSPPSNGNLMRARLFGRKTGGRRRKNRRTRRAV
jgi:hypothetical protein